MDTNLNSPVTPKSNKTLLLTIIALAVIGGIIFVVYKTKFAKQPATLPPDVVLGPSGNKVINKDQTGELQQYTTQMSQNEILEFYRAKFLEGDYNIVDVATGNQPNGTYNLVGENPYNIFIVSIKNTAPNTRSVTVSIRNIRSK